MGPHAFAKANTNLGARQKWYSPQSNQIRKANLIITFKKIKSRKSFLNI